MIIELAVIFFIIGMGLGTMDMFVPMPPELTPMIFMNRMLGLVFLIVGIMLLLSRGFATGSFYLMDLPKNGRVLLFHQRKGKNPNTTIIPGKLKDLEYIKTKKKIFKDTGNGFRIAGHDCRRTHEMIAFDIPDWLGEWFSKVKHDFNVKNKTDLYELYNGLNELCIDDSEEETLRKLNSIDCLKPLLMDDKKKQYFANLGFDDLVNLRLQLFDGQVVRMEDVEEFIDSATPNELDALVKQEYLNDVMREKNYSDPGEMNWMKWIPAFGFLLLCGAIAAIILQGAFGG